MSLSISIISNKRVLGLDILRAFAILTVVYSHGVIILPSAIRFKASLFSFDGVSVFFVLSGFLIGSILIKTLETEEMNFTTLGNFMIRRWFRTLPLYFLILALLALYFKEKLTSIEIERYIVFIQNFNTPHPTFFPEAWSLAVEEWFYLLVPFTSFILISVFKMKSKKAVLLVILMIIVFITAIRYYKSFHIRSGLEWDFILRKQVVTRLDSIVFGLLGAYLNYYYQSIWLRRKKIALIVGTIIFFFVHYSYYFLDLLGGVNGIYNCVFSFTLTSVGVLLTLPFFSSLKHKEGYIYKAITFISLISYSMYLVNLIIVKEIAIPFTLKYIDIPVKLSYVRYAWFWLYTILFSFLLYRFFEKPFMKLRDKITTTNKAKVSTIVS